MISANVLVDDLNEVKVEQENFQDSCRSPAKENKVTPNNFNLLERFDKYPENRIGEFRSFISKYYLRHILGIYLFLFRLIYS